MYHRTELGKVISVVVLRLGILIPLALVLAYYFIRECLQLERPFEIALFTLLILPPPFILPLYTQVNLEIEEKQYINNVLAVHTVISIVIFLVHFAINQ